MWVDRAPPAKKTGLIPLLRATADHSVSGRLCGEPLRIFMHFSNGRSWPCIGRGCYLCSENIPRRYYAYYPIRSKKGKLGIMELTSQAESQLDEQMSKVTQVVSGSVLLRREPGRRNMPCTIEWTLEMINDNPIVESIEVRALQRDLMRIWNLPNINEHQTEREYLEALNTIIKLRCKHNYEPT